MANPGTFTGFLESLSDTQISMSIDVSPESTVIVTLTRLDNEIHVVLEKRRLKESRADFALLELRTAIIRLIDDVQR